MKKPVFEGLCTALATPFDFAGKVDFGSLGRMVDFQVHNGASALALCATTGEGVTLEEHEFVEIISFARERVGGKVPVIASTGRNSTESTLRLSLLAQNHGADALLIVNPYYNKSTQTGIAEHYEYIADRVSTPIILYSVPSRTGIAIAPETYGRLSRHPMIYGAKEASGDISLVAHAVKESAGDFVFYSGNDEQTLPIMALGGRGVISTTANIAPKKMSSLCAFFASGELEKAKNAQLELLELIDAMFCETNPIPLKYALSLMELCSERVRLPLVPPSPGSKQRIKNALQKFELLPKKV